MFLGERNVHSQMGIHGQVPRSAGICSVTCFDITDTVLSNGRPNRGTLVNHLGRPMANGHKISTSLWLVMPRCLSVSGHTMVKYS